MLGTARLLIQDEQALPPLFTQPRAQTVVHPPPRRRRLFARCWMGCERTAQAGDSLTPLIDSGVTTTRTSGSPTFRATSSGGAAACGTGIRKTGRLFLLSLANPQPGDQALAFQGSVTLTMATSESPLSIPHTCSLPHASLSCTF